MCFAGSTNTVVGRVLIDWGSIPLLVCLTDSQPFTGFALVMFTKIHLILSIEIAKYPTVLVRSLSACDMWMLMFATFHTTGDAIFAREVCGIDPYPRPRATAHVVMHNWTAIGMLPGGHWKVQGRGHHLSDNMGSQKKTLVGIYLLLSNFFKGIHMKGLSACRPTSILLF